MRTVYPGILVGALLLTGCSSSDGTSVGDSKKMNMQEAAEHADKILDGTFAAIEPTVHWTHGESTEGSCDVSRRRAVMTVISEARRGNFLGVVERYWKSQGYSQIGMNRNAKSPAMYFQTPDEFNVRLLIGDNGQAFFEVATPCVEKSSVSPPASKTVGPNYAGKPIPDPNVHSDFWSPSTPITSASPTRPR